MAISYNKRELEKKREQKRQEKQKRKEDNKANKGHSSFDDMIAYVDENGVITSTPPDLSRKQEIDIDDIAISIPKKEEAEDSILKGRVEFFNKEKGYGFIKEIGSINNKYFFHVSMAPSEIIEGNMVIFELERGQKGMNAVNICINKDNNQIINN